MIEDIKIRPAQMEDSEAIFHFIEELEEVRFDDLLFKKYYAESLQNKSNIYLVAETEEGEIAGYISCHGQVLLHHLAKVFEIQELFVKKEFRSQKTGSLLLRTVEKIVQEKGYHLLEVTANIKRANTHLFYKSNGFVHTHQKFTKEL